MDIRQLSAFCQLCRLKNFTKTAGALGYAQSSITFQIKQLEAELGTKLFERIGKSVYLTESGRRILPHAQKMLFLAKDIKEAANGDASFKGTIAIGAAESICTYRLPYLLKTYKAAHPDVEVCLRLMDYDDFLPALNENRIDIAFSIGVPLNAPSVDILLEHPESIAVLSAPGHPLAGKECISAQDFSGEKFLLTSVECQYHKAFMNDMSEKGVTVCPVLETESLQAIKKMTAIGFGLCVLPEVAVLDEIGGQSLFRLPYKTEYRIVSQVLVHKDKWISPLLDEFVHTVLDEYAKSE